MQDYWIKSLLRNVRDFPELDNSVAVLVFEYKWEDNFWVDQLRQYIYWLINWNVTIDKFWQFNLEVVKAMIDRDGFYRKYAIKDYLWNRIEKYWVKWFDNEASIYIQKLLEEREQDKEAEKSSTVKGNSIWQTLKMTEKKKWWFQKISGWFDWE